MKNKNVLEFCLSPALGGLELFVKTSFEFFKTKTNCYVCVAQNKLLDKNIHDINKITLKRNKFLPIIPALKIAKYIDIVHFHWTRDIVTLVLAKLLSKKKPKIIQSRHMRMTRFKSDFYHRWLYKNIDTIHAVTKKVKKQLIKYIPQDVRPKIEMVYLGVDEPEIDEKKLQDLRKKHDLKAEFIVGIIGRIEEGKGQHIVIEAIAKLKKLNIKALVVGRAMSDEYQESLNRKVKEFGIEDKVVFTGFTKDVNGYMQLCDTVVLATVEETFGLVVIEAMINKRPVIAVNKGGPLEIINDGIDGLLFERNSEALKNKIKILYNNNNFKNNITLSGYNKIKENYNKNIQNFKIYNLIQEL